MPNKAVSVMPNIIDRRSVCLAVSISSIQNVGPGSVTLRTIPISKERQNGYQSK